MAQWQRARLLPARFQVRALVGELDGALAVRRTKRVSGDASGLISPPVHVRLVAPLPVPLGTPLRSHNRPCTRLLTGHESGFESQAEHRHVLLDETGRR